MNLTTIDPGTLQAMQASLAKYKGGGSGAPASVAAPQPAPVSPAGATGPAPIDNSVPSGNSTNDAIAASLAAYKSGNKSPSKTPEIPKDPGILADFAKGIFGGVGTLAARPLQLGAEALGVSSENVNKGTNAVENAIGSVADKIPLIGGTIGNTIRGLVAPVPQNAGDVEKDIGRGAETVALGLPGAPIAAGALFGAGNSLEQGNDLLSTKTALETAAGAGGGKLLDLIGRPLLSRAGKVIGTITPGVLKDVAAGGAKAVQQFAAEHDLPLGISSVSAPLSEEITKGANAIDTGINKGVSTVASGAKAGFLKQYPGADLRQHYQTINEADIVKPTTINKAAYKNATNIYTDAEARGIDLGKQATKLGIHLDNIKDGSSFDTLDTAEQIRQKTYDAAKRIGNPAIEHAQQDVARVPISDVKNAILERVNNMPNIRDDVRANFVKQVTNRYAPGSAADLAHPHGYNLKDLNTGRITGQQDGKYIPGEGSATPNALTARLSREEGSAFSSLFDRSAPDDIGLKAFKKEQESNFMLADYLEALHTKAVPQSVPQKAVRLFGRAVGGVIGSKVGGFPGFLFGSRGGDMLFNTFETLPNPLKNHVLDSIKIQDPEAYVNLKKYIKQKEAEAAARPLLTASAQTHPSAPATPTLFSSPGTNPSPSLQEVIDASGSRTAKKPTTNRRLSSYLSKVKNAQENNGPYTPPGQLPVIR